MKTPPDKIYLQFHGDEKPEEGEEIFIREEDVTWAQNRVYDSDIEYTRTPAITPAQVENLIDRIQQYALGQIRDRGMIESGELRRIIAEELAK